MSIVDFARRAGALATPSLVVPDGGNVEVFLDRGQTPVPVFLHMLHNRRSKCPRSLDPRAPCGLCDATPKVQRRDRYTLDVDVVSDEGEVVPHKLWVGFKELGRFAQALVDSGGDSGGNSRFVIGSEPELDDNGNKKPRRGGDPVHGPFWHTLTFRAADRGE